MTMFYTIFSMQVKEFSTLLRSISSLWLGMLGELSMTDELWAAKEWAVPCVILFTFVSVFVLLTLIIAIISNAHERIKTTDDENLLKEKRLASSVVSALKTYKRTSRVGSSISLTSQLSGTELVGDAFRAGGDTEPMASIDEDPRENQKED